MSIPRAMFSLSSLVLPRRVSDSAMNIFSHLSSSVSHRLSWIPRINTWLSNILVSRSITLLVSSLFFSLALCTHLNSWEFSSCSLALSLDSACTSLCRLLISSLIGISNSSSAFTIDQSSPVNIFSLVAFSCCFNSSGSAILGPDNSSSDRQFSLMYFLFSLIMS